MFEQSIFSIIFYNFRHLVYVLYNFSDEILGMFKKLWFRITGRSEEDYHISLIKEHSTEFFDSVTLFNAARVILENEMPYSKKDRIKILSFFHAETYNQFSIDPMVIEGMKSYYRIFDDFLAHSLINELEHMVLYAFSLHKVTMFQKYRDMINSINSKMNILEFRKLLEKKYV